MKDVCDFLHTLGLRAAALLRTPHEEEVTYEFQQGYFALVASTVQVLGHSELLDYRARVTQEVAEHQSKLITLTVIAGLLQSARECLERGFAGRLKRVLHAEMFGDLASQARGLLQAGHRISAAVLGRIALEKWLRDEAEAAGIPNHDSAKASALNEALKAAAKFTQPKWRHIQSLLDIGNAAAHGQDSQFTNEDVIRLLTFVETNCFE